MEIRMLMYFFWKEVIKDLFLQNRRTILPVLRIALHKRPPVHIAHVGFAIGSQQVEATNLLSELLHNSIAHKFLGRG